MNMTPTKLLLVFLLIYTTVAVVMLLDRWRYCISVVSFCMPSECLSFTMSPGLINWLSASSYALTTVAGTGWRLTWQLHHEKKIKNRLITFCWIPRVCMSKQRGGGKRSLCELCVGSQAVSHDGAVWFECVLKIIRCSLSAEHFSYWKNSLKSRTLHLPASRCRPLPLVSAPVVRADGTTLRPQFPFSECDLADCGALHSVPRAKQNTWRIHFRQSSCSARICQAARSSLLLGRMFIAVKWPPLHLCLQPATWQRLAEKNGPEWHLFALLNDRQTPVEALVGRKSTEL